MRTVCQITILFSAIMTGVFGLFTGQYLGKVEAAEKGAEAAVAVFGSFSLFFLLVAFALSLVLIFKKDGHAEDHDDEDEHDEDHDHAPAHP